jgi:hypothetical protein
MDHEVEAYVSKQVSPLIEICIELIKIISKTFPEIKEEMRWGVPTYGIETPDGIYTKYYIGAMKNKVHLGFSVKDLTEEEKDLFEGKGKLMRHVKIFSVEEIDEERIVKLLRMIPDP